jgi:polar amino acid transport system ATP-binding protein
MTNTTTARDATSWFSHTVPEAHATFVATATAAGLDVEIVEHPLRGPGGETLHSAVTTFGPDDARSVVLCLSGIHGIEGYFGSAIQCDAIANAPDLLRFPADTKVVFIHLVNPWGTAWSSRENEDNVELLRGNYYCHHDKPANPVFVDFADTMDYASIGSVKEFLATRSRAADVLNRHPVEQLMAAIGAGQDTHPDAITYTGAGPTWSKRLIDRVVRQRCANAERVLVFDLHTAVGPPGDTVVFTGYVPNSPKDRMVRGWFDGDLWPWPEYLDFYGWVGELVPGADVVSVTMEAGTEQLGPADQYIFPLDVWIKTYGDRNDPAAAPHLERYRRFFYPETPEWMRSTLAHGRRRWEPLLAGLAEWTAFGARANGTTSTATPGDPS